MPDNLTKPNIKTIWRDNKKNFTFEILAYRKLTPAEVRYTLRNYLSEKK